MAQTCIAFVDMPRMLREIVDDALSRRRGVKLVDECRDEDGLVAAVDRSGAGFLIVSSEAVGPEDVCRLLEQRPHVKVFAIADGGRDGCLYEMRTNLMLVNELSPASLRHAVFGGNGQPDAGFKKTKATGGNR
ncbi:MAG TPA: hypothetical protein VHS03_13185 [Gaiellaceae bacterium]|nr:hypothetical protein [Gaiellaceae bacterium]